MAALRRIQKELATLHKEPIPGVTIETKDDNLLLWTCSIRGPAGTPYEGGTFKLTMDFTDKFPFKPPVVAFTTKMYHPGVNEEGAICLPVLKDEWQPTMTVKQVLLKIVDKVGNPSVDDPFMPDIATQLKNDQGQFITTAKEWTKQYAM
ncbi:hypothetical protein BOTBODRAFT_39391 [Botryobasidium botryosum FD-172 SS1]|uniref:E2 ubiquitin-conjugating enzyme n=1 Tax=Botryobasidium botryosum (strain FD-172 SS1) TaxID=930990 RepID=A0A067LUD8_BOTB1|nr:hypothetical protein BOTBODRAFT_39391 [Botryobasidium botryosum FD-172 SS1]